MTTETIRIEYGSDHVIMSWDGAQASAPIKVNGVQTPYQTADARHRTDYAVAIACAWAWGEAEWPAIGGGSDDLEPTKAWDDMSWDYVEDEDEDEDEDDEMVIVD